MEELRYSKKRIRIYIGTLLGVILAIGLIIVCNHCVSEKKSDSKYNESIETNGSIIMAQLSRQKFDVFIMN